MKMLVLVSTLLIGSAFADDHEEKLAERKAKAVENIGKRIDSLNQLKSCIQGASEKGDMKQCRKDHKARMEPLRKEWKEKRGKRKGKGKKKDK